jgi:hypothetical protein
LIRTAAVIAATPGPLFTSAVVLRKARSAFRKNGRENVMSVIFGEIRQVAYVTRDFDKTVDFFLHTGIGPWFVDKKRLMKGVSYLGNKIDVEMTVGLAYSGSLQLEIVEQTGPSRSIYTDWLDKHPSEMLVQHVSSWPIDFAATEKRVFEAGYRLVMGGMLSAGMFGYYNHSDHPEFIFEMAEETALRRHIWDAMEKITQSWDGKTDPVRPWPVPPADLLAAQQSATAR